MCCFCRYLRLRACRTAAVGLFGFATGAASSRLMNQQRATQGGFSHMPVHIGHLGRVMGAAACGHSMHQREVLLTQVQLVFRCLDVQFPLLSATKTARPLICVDRWHCPRAGCWSVRYTLRLPGVCHAAGASRHTKQHELGVRTSRMRAVHRALLPNGSDTRVLEQQSPSSSVIVSTPGNSKYTLLDSEILTPSSC